MSLRLNKVSMLLIAWLLTWLLLTVWGLERSQHNIPQVIPMPPYCDRQLYRSHMRHNGMSQSDDGNGKSKKDWDRRFAHRLKIQMTNLEEEEKQDQIKDTQIKQALMKMMNKKLKDNKLAPNNKHLHIAPGMDFRLEFASDESNPYIENTRSQHAPLD